MVRLGGHLGTASGGIGFRLQLAGGQPFVGGEDFLLDHLAEVGHIARGHGFSWLSTGVSSDVLESELATAGDLLQYYHQLVVHLHGGVCCVAGGCSSCFGGGRCHLVSDGGVRGVQTYGQDLLTL